MTSVEPVAAIAVVAPVAALAAVAGFEVMLAAVQAGGVEEPTLPELVSTEITVAAAEPTGIEWLEGMERPNLPEFRRPDIAGSSLPPGISAQVPQQATARPEAGFCRMPNHDDPVDDSAIDIPADPTIVQFAAPVALLLRPEVERAVFSLDPPLDETKASGAILPPPGAVVSRVNALVSLISTTVLPAIHVSPATASPQQPAVSARVSPPAVDEESIVARAPRLPRITSFAPLAVAPPINSPVPPAVLAVLTVADAALASVVLASPAHVELATLGARAEFPIAAQTPAPSPLLPPSSIIVPAPALGYVLATDPVVAGSVSPLAAALTAFQAAAKAPSKPVVRSLGQLHESAVETTSATPSRILPEMPWSNAAEQPRSASQLVAPVDAAPTVDAVVRDRSSGFAVATERLGALHIQLQPADTLVRVHVTAERGSTAMLIAGQGERLQTAVETGGYRLAALSVDIRDGDTGRRGPLWVPQDATPRRALPVEPDRVRRADRFA